MSFPVLSREKDTQSSPHQAEGYHPKPAVFEEGINSHKRKFNQVQTDLETTELKWNVISTILLLKLEQNGNVDDELNHDIHGKIKLKFDIDSSRTRKIWQEYIVQFKTGVPVISMRNGAGSPGSSAHHFRDRVDDSGNAHNIADIVDKIKMINNRYRCRVPVRSLSAEMKNEFGIDIPKSTLDYILIAHRFEFHKTYSKPKISAKNKIKRVEYVLEQIDFTIPPILINGKWYYTFKHNKGRVWLDEKWFYTKRIKERV
jgi:hypothetical protein